MAAPVAVAQVALLTSSQNLCLPCTSGVGRKIRIQRLFAGLWLMNTSLSLDDTFSHCLLCFTQGGGEGSHPGGEGSGW